MAWQLIFTSSQRTLTPGQSGFGTVARSLDLREALIQRLEQLSYYDPAIPAAPAGLPGATSSRPTPAVFAHRLLDLRGTTYHLLSRIVVAPLDFTHRTNHLAHHLVFSPAELADLPSPATLLGQWDGWKDAWTGEPRFLDESDWGNLPELPRSVPLPAAAWARHTGDAGRAAALVDSLPPGGQPMLVAPAQQPALLQLFAESLQLLDPDLRAPGRRWQFPFTTCLQRQDQASDFLWRALPAATSALAASGPAGQSGPRRLEELAIPEGPRTQLARQGTNPAPASTAPQSSSNPASPGQRIEPRSSTALKLSRATPRAEGTRPMQRSTPDSELLREPGIPEFPGANARAGQGLRLRVFLPVLGIGLLALMLAGGFLWPGWFLAKPGRIQTATTSGKSSPGATAPTPGETETTPGPATQAPAPTPIPTASNLPLPSTPGVTAPEDSEPPAIDDDAGRVFEAAFDTLPTYLVLPRAGEDPARIPAFPEIGSLLRRVFGENPDVPKESIGVLVQSGDLRFSVAPTLREIQPALEQFGGKRLSISLPAAPAPIALLDCSEWLKDPAQPLLLSGFRAADRALTLVFRPSAGTTTFPPFRLLLVGGTPAKPVELRKSHLRAGRTNVSESLDPELFARLPRSVEPGSPANAFRFQFRPFVGSPATNLFDTSPVDYQPAEGSELAFAFHRARVESRMAELTRDLERQRGKAAELGNQAENTTTNDLRLGSLLGIRRQTLDRKPTREAHLASLAEFARARRSHDLPDREDFIEYLRALLGHLAIPCEDLLNPVRRKPTDRDLAQLQTRLASADRRIPPGAAETIPPGYFTNRWMQFGTVDLLHTLNEQASAVSNRIARLHALRDRIPASLDAVPRVSLHVVDARGPRLELIRFTDPPAPPAP
jgi:hypothetical protein